MGLADSDGDILHYYHICPIGTIVALHKSMSGVPTIGEGWVECNGGTVSDSESLMNGIAIPNLNGAGGSDQRFLRGSSASGSEGGEDTHQLTEAEMPSHTHSYTYIQGPSGSDGAAGGKEDRPATTGLKGGDQEHENRPPFFEIVWIMRIK